MDVKEYPSEWDIWNDIDEERIAVGDLKEVKHADHSIGTKSDGKHDENVQGQKESEVGVLRIDSGEKAGEPEMAQVVPVKKSRKRSQWKQVDGKFVRATKTSGDRRGRTARRGASKPTQGGLK